MKNVEAIGQTIRRLRKERGFSQETLAYESEVNRSHLSTIERGLQLPTLDTLFKLAEALNTSAAQILAMAEGGDEALTEGMTESPALPSRYLEDSEQELRQIMAGSDTDEAVAFLRFKLVERPKIRSGLVGGVLGYRCPGVLGHWGPGLFWRGLASLHVLDRERVNATGYPL